MKKSLYIVLTAIAFIAVSCEKKSPSVDPMPGKEVSMKFTCGTETASSTKTTVTDGTSVVWQWGDYIDVFNNAGEASTSGFELVDGDGTNKGVFEGSVAEGAPYYALYPYSNGLAEKVDNTILFYLPPTQAYAENTFAQGAMPAAGTASATGDIKFKNLCGVLKLQLKGAEEGMKVTNIELTGKNNEVLAGKASVVLDSDPNPVAILGAGDETLNLDLFDPEHGELGVALSTIEAKEFWFVVPVGAFTQGFDAKVYFEYQGTPHTQMLSTTNAQTIERGVVRIMPTVTINEPETITLSQSYVTIPYGESVEGIEVTSSGDWTAGPLPVGYFALDPASGKAGKTSIALTNKFTGTGETSFPINFVINGTETYAQLYVTLKGQPSHDLIVSPTTQTFGVEGGSFKFSVYATEDFTATAIPTISGVRIYDGDGNDLETGMTFKSGTYNFTADIQPVMSYLSFDCVFTSKLSTVEKISFYLQE